MLFGQVIDGVWVNCIEAAERPGDGYRVVPEEDARVIRAIAKACGPNYEIRDSAKAGDAFLPHGWSAAGWACHLRSVAESCRPFNPARADELDAMAESFVPRSQEEQVSE